MSTNEIYRTGYPEEPYPLFKVEIHLGLKKTTIIRQAYTLLDLLGDFGGFNDALFFFGRIFLASYSSRMFISSIATELPI